MAVLGKVEATAHGPINKAARSAGEQAALDKRKKEILQTKTKEQIEAAYSGQAVQINEHLARKKKRNDDIDAQIRQLRDEHEMEMRVIKANLSAQDEKREADAGKQSRSESEQPAVKKISESEKNQDDHEEGEIQGSG